MSNKHTRITDETMLQALLTTSKVTDTAKLLNISVQSVYNRLNKPEFRARLETERANNFNIASTKLTDAMANSIETLLEVMNNPKTPAMARIRSADIILSITLKTNEQMDIIRKIEELEQRLDCN